MKLVLAIVLEEQSDTIMADLMGAGYRATIISTMGGFLRRGNTTLLIGVEASCCDDVLARIRKACQPRPVSGRTERWVTAFVLDVDQDQHV